MWEAARNLPNGSDAVTAFSHVESGQRPAGRRDGLCGWAAVRYGSAMETLLYAFLALLAGAGLPVQASVNSAMRQELGRPEWAALVNFMVGTLALACWLFVQRAAVPPAAAWARAPWWAWTGGLLGAFFVAVTVLLTPRLGLVALLALMLAGQVTAAVALDHFGLLGLAARAFTPARAVGAVLLVAGVLLVQR